MPRPASSNARTPHFEAGQPLRDQLTADRLNSLNDVSAENQLSAGRGLLMTRRPGGATVTIAGLRRGSAKVSKSPFQIVNSVDGATLWPYSYVMASLKVDDLISIVNFDLILVPSTDSKVYLEVDVNPDDLSVTGVTLTQGSWDVFPEVARFNGDDHQDKAYVLLGYFVTKIDPRKGTSVGDFKYIQVVSNNLIMRNVAYSNHPIVFAFPYTGPFVASS